MVSALTQLSRGLVIFTTSMHSPFQLHGRSRVNVIILRQHYDVI